jgi:hypothetical protein
MFREFLKKIINDSDMQKYITFHNVINSPEALKYKDEIVAVKEDDKNGDILVEFNRIFNNLSTFYREVK